MMAIRRAAAATLTQRAVHMTIVPRPANLAESREILRVLQRFGPMEMYKHLRHEYFRPMDNVALGIYRDADAARQALDASPIRFSLEIEDNSVTKEKKAVDDMDEAEYGIQADGSTETGIDDMLRPGELLTNPRYEESSIEPASDPPSKSLPFEPPSETPNTVPKWFQITIDRSRVVHYDYIEKQFLWGRYMPMKTVAQEDLAKKVPHKGLSDVGQRPPGVEHRPHRAMRNDQAYADDRMPTVKRIWMESGNRNENARR
ncbi:hypothetical protein DM02DRAFT_720 [Periconia macrospinosa]|uniref:Uncharacterized protein n=1 Tax=Periconia macrospinosa TaxID=97972 RepID=A0A2V1ECG1_9PLEO|nr:hypothetical protein DM02DRAFT_720 [Periconia macrospinosa]